VSVRAGVLPREAATCVHDDVRVSELLAASVEVLPLLVRHGFTPLQNPAMRAALAPTVTLAQAIRLRGLSDHAAEDLRRELSALLDGPAPCR
jgi:hypothetical protein